MFDLGISHLNVYRLIGDGSHLLALVWLAGSLIWRRNARGVSGKTQLLYLLTYTFRYMDLWLQWTFLSYYNTVYKVFFIATCSLLVYLLYTTNRETFDFDGDSFPLMMIIAPVTLLAFLVNYEPSFMEICWTWSMYMEAVALIPQLHMIWKTGYPSTSILIYIFLMGLYRGMYIGNWIYRYYHEGFLDKISIVSGVIETAIAAVAFIGIFSLKLRKCSDYSSQPPSVYTLPHVLNLGGNGKYKPIPAHNYPLLHGDNQGPEKVAINSAEFQGYSNDMTISGGSGGYVL